MFRTSIRNKLIAFLLSAMLIPVIVSIAMSYVIIRNNVSKEAIATNTGLLFQGKTNIQNYLIQLQKSTLAVYNDEDLFEILDEPEPNEEGAGYWLESRNEVLRVLQSVSYSVFEIRQVYLYMETSRRPFALFDKSFAYNLDPLSKYIPPDERRELYIDPPHPVHTYGLGYTINVPKDQVFTMYRTIYNTLTKRRLGTIAVDVSPAFLASLCNQLYQPGKEEVYLLDASGNVIFSPYPEEAGTKLQADWVKELGGRKEGHGRFDWKQKDFSGIILYEKLDSASADWTLVKRIPYGHLNRSAVQLTRINTAIFSIFLLVALAATVWISLRFTNPIRKLAGYMNRIQSGDFSVDIEIKGSDELAMLGRRFRAMMQRLNDLILREYTLEIANKTNELKALQAQINPHFLNNALQSIGTVALQHNDRQVYSLIASLGKMMRYSMNTNESVVKVADELDYIKAYLDLQRQRFGERLTFRFEVDPDATGIPIPKMTLQPIVENVFKHAFRDVSDQREIIIRCGFREGDTFLEVADNGAGVDEETLEKVRRGPVGGVGSGLSGGIGLSNVRSRLALFYDGAGAMELANIHPRGFSVTIRIPGKKEAASE